MTATRQEIDLGSESDFGVIVDPSTVRFERVFPGPIERVWSYFTQPDKLSKWIAKTEDEARPGAVMEFRWDHSKLSPHKEPTPAKYQQFQNALSRWRITRFEAPRVMSWIWDEGSESESEMTIELTPKGDDVLLVLTHGRLPKRESASETAGGWHTHLAILSDNLAGRVPRPFWSYHAAVEEAYNQRARGNSIKR